MDEIGGGEGEGEMGTGAGGGMAEGGEERGGRIDERGGGAKTAAATLGVLEAIGLVPPLRFALLLLFAFEFERRGEKERAEKGEV
jgi:hypothetical protein